MHKAVGLAVAVEKIPDIGVRRHGHKEKRHGAGLTQRRVSEVALRCPANRPNAAHEQPRLLPPNSLESGRSRDGDSRFQRWRGRR